MIIEDKNGDQWVVEKDQSTGKTKVSKVEGGGLIVGSDGHVLTKKELRKLDRMILASLKKYKKAIEDYQASIKQAPSKSKGGGPSLFEWEIEMFLAELPQCLNEHKDKLDNIHSGIVKLEDTESKEFKEFVSAIEAVITEEEPSEEKVEGVVCEAIVEGLTKSNFAGVYFQESPLENEQVLFFQKDIETELTFVAKGLKKGVAENIKVNWNLNGEDAPDGAELKIIIDGNFFKNNNRIKLQVIDKVLLGSDPMVVFYLEGLDLNVSTVVDSLLLNLKSIQDNFDDLANGLAKSIEPTMDEISLLGDPKYFSKGLSSHLEVSSNNPVSTFDKTLLNMYQIDMLMNQIEDFDNILKLATELMANVEAKQVFYKGIIDSVEEQSPLEVRSILEKNYRNQIVTTTYKNLKNLVSKK